MKLYFEDRYSRLRELTNVENRKEAGMAIADFLAHHNYKSYYTRNWVRTVREDLYYVVYDVGSHSEFFLVEFNTRDAADKFLREGIDV